MLICKLILASSILTGQVPKPEVIIAGGRVFDGSGKPARQVDVAIRGDRIVAIGDLSKVQAKRRIDARGLIIAPGFIDLHSHSDRPIVRENTKRNLNYLKQGVTSVVTGNCGSGPVNVGNYLKTIDENGAGTNVLHLLPHGNLRRQVIGIEKRPPSPKELDEMKQLADKAMRDGAWGMSTGLIYVPSSYSTTEELVALAKVVGSHRGIYATHMRGEGTGLLRSIEEAIRIGREAKLPVHISHFKASGLKAWGLAAPAIQLILGAREDGQQVTADQYPYTASSTSLAAMVIPARFRDRKKFEAALKEPKSAKSLRKAIGDGVERRGKGERLLVASYRHNRKLQGKNIAEIARQKKLDPVDLVIEMQRNGGASMINFGMSDEEVRLIMKQPFVATASDGSARTVKDSTQPHPRSFGTFPRKIGRYCLRENTIDLAHAIRSCTGLPADILKLPTRGYIRKNYAADLVIFDPKTFIDTATFQKPLQLATGVKYLFVNGKLTIDDGKFNGVLAGRALRHK